MLVVAVRRRLGFSLIEIVVALVVIALFASAAIPRFDRYLSDIRRRADLDAVVSELYHARMLAIQHGGGVRLVLRPSPSGCVSAVVISVDYPDARSLLHPVAARTHCLRHTGDSVMHFNSRGMLRPPSRSIFVTGSTVSDSVVVSVSGRVRRSY